MKTRIRTAIALSITLLTGSAQAQYTDNNQTNTISGVASNWAGDYYVGQFYGYDALLIQSGGALSNGFGYVGYGVGAGGNAVLVTGSGSVWSNANDLSVGYLGIVNSMTISNGGAVYNSVNGYIGNQAGADDNTVLVTGTGSYWNSAFALIVGFFGAGNSLTVADGGAVSDAFGDIGAAGNANNNAVLVTGNGSVWRHESGMHIGERGSGNSLTIADGGLVDGGPSSGSSIGDYAGANNNTVLVTDPGSAWSSVYLTVGVAGAGNSLTITNGGTVIIGSIFGGSAFIGYAYTNGGNGITVSGGGLSVSSGVLDVRDGTLTLNSGTVTANQLLLTNGASSVIAFNGGLLASSGTSVTNGQLFVVGDGTDAATFHLNGGVHSFADDLEISNNATLSGCGTINGNVTIDPGGTVIADCGGTLTFTGIVTNNGTMLVVNGTALQVDGQMVNNGTINALNGSTQFPGGLVNNGCVSTADNARISSLTRSGNDITVQIPSATCGWYQLQVTPSLKPATWTNLGASQGGTGGVLTFTDTNEATNRPSRFYRIGISAQAQVISFAGNGAGWQVNSSGIATAPFTDDVLTLTDNNNGEARSAWYTIQQSIAPGFTASFTYQASGNKLADGVTFTIQNSGTFALGGAGGNLGYSGITPSAAVQINIYSPNVVGTSYKTNGQVAPPFTSSSPVNLASGDPINVTLVYDPVHGTLSESLQDANTSQTYGTVYNVGDLSALLGDSKAFIGFTGGTGGLASTQTISNFQFSATAPPP